LEELDQAIDDQIELQVLVHAFSVEEDGAFMEKFASGLEHAQAANTEAEEALDELANRRTGLAVSLVLVVLVLVGLGLKIRAVDSKSEEKI
jgi:hypothetical protein